MIVKDILFVVILASGGLLAKCTEDTVTIPLYQDDSAQIDYIPDKVYAGPLKSTDDANEVIIVSRDNVQQLIKTLMLAYINSDDPTMNELLKHGQLGPLKNTFKNFGKEKFGKSFLKSAQKLIAELKLENDQEEALSEFAEGYLRENKFKIIVPESFILNEKEMLEFLDKKKKSSRRKKGRSLLDEKPTEDVTIEKAITYEGRQFSSSVIPGINLPWWALLGMLMAAPIALQIPDMGMSKPSTARKDEIASIQTIESINLPPGLARNEMMLRGKRQGMRFKKMPPHFNPNLLGNKEYQKALSNYYSHQMKQLPEGALPPNTLMTPALIGIPPGSPLPPPGNGRLNLINGGQMPPQNILYKNIHHPGPFMHSPHGQIDRHFNQASPISTMGLIPPPSAGKLSSQENIPSTKIESPEESVNQTQASSLPFDLNVPRPNSILNAANVNPVKSMNEDATNLDSDSELEAQPAVDGVNLPRLASRFPPTHLPPHPAIYNQMGPHGMRPILPNSPLQRIPGVNFPPHNPRGPLPPRHFLQIPPHMRPYHPMRRHPGLPFAMNPHANGNTMMKEQVSSVVSPLLPPPVLNKTVDNNEGNESLESTKTPGSSHFKVSFDSSRNEITPQVDPTYQTTPNTAVTYSRPKPVVKPNLAQVLRSKNVINPNAYVPTASKEQKFKKPSTHQLKYKKETYRNKESNSPKPVYIIKNQKESKPFSKVPQNQYIYSRGDDGFLPVYGPPPSPQVLRPSFQSKVPKPSAFLDKLLAEQKEKKSALKNSQMNIQNSFKPVKKEETTTESVATSEVPETTIWPKTVEEKEMVTEVSSAMSAMDVRVVTSKSVVTSRPVPLGKHHPAFYGFSGQNEKDKYIVVGEAVYDTNATVNEINVSKEAKNKKYTSIDDMQSTFEQDYKKVLKGYQRKQLDSKHKKPTYIAKKDLKNSAKTSKYAVMSQNSAGFVKTDGGEVNRILKVSKEEIEKNKTNEEDVERDSKSMAVYGLDPFYGPRLSRVDAIFTGHNVTEEGCREQFICNVYKNPEAYSPASDFISRQLTVTLEELQKPQVADERILRFFRYLQSARTGQDGHNCVEKNPNCSYDTSSLAHQPMLTSFYNVNQLITS